MAATPRPKPWLTKNKPRPSPKHRYAGPTIRRYCAPIARHLGVVAEQAEPKARLQRDDQSDRSAHGGGRDRAGPSDLARAVILPCAPVRPHHRDNRSAEAKSDRLHDVFEPGSHSVANGGLGTELPGDACQNHDGQIGNGRVHQAGNADLENIGEQFPSRRYSAEVQPHDRTRGAQIAIIIRLPTAKGITRPQPAPAGPSAGMGPSRRSAGARARYERRRSQPARPRAGSYFLCRARHCRGD